MIEGELALALFASVCILLLFGFPVALTLGGTALLFASFGVIAGHFDASFRRRFIRPNLRHDN